MLGTLIGLFAFHRKRRDADREKRLQYWKEQVRVDFIPPTQCPSPRLECIPSKPQECA